MSRLGAAISKLVRSLFPGAVVLLTFLTPPVIAANRFTATGQERPNFLFLLSDDQAHRALSRLGELEVKTPNLDRLSKRGMLFTHCFNQGGYSGAVCIPSRTMLNTGRPVWQCRDAKGDGIAEGAALWGETLGQAGYDTFMAGKWHIPQNALERSFKTIGPLTGGFLASTTNGGAAYHRPAPGNSWTPDDARWKGHWLEVDGKVIHSSVRIADAAIGYLRTNAVKSAKPFFMYVAFTAPHDPRQAPREFLDLYPPAKLKLPPNFLPRHPFPIDGYDGRDEILGPYPRTPEIIQTHLQEYYAIITHLDTHIGRILDALEASGEAANTVVIFTSDQGLAVGQHGLLGKQNLYDHSLRMPFIMAGPGIPRGKRHDALFNMQSLFATTCEMAGVPVPESVWFPSLVPLITGQKKQLHDALYGAFLNLQRAVRTEEWKLIRTPPQEQVQLFNVKRDPWEMRNLAADPKHATTLRMLDTKLRELMQEMKDPMPVAQLDASSRPDRTAPAGTGRKTRPTATSSQPNIILVMTDDQGYGDLGCTGNPVLKSPNIDAFYRESVRFTDFHVSPTCAPTRSALMTGRHEFKNGVTHTIHERERMTLKATTIAQVLKKAGYATGIFGKWHLGDEAAYQPGKRGFDEVFIHGAGGIGQTYAGSCGDAPGNSYFNPAILHNGRFEKTTGYCTDVFFAESLRWINERRTSGKPFFAYIAPNAPHDPLDCPEEYFRRYQGKVSTNAAKFFGMIQNIDDNFGALLKKLEAWGLVENTLVIFMTDNGGTVGVRTFNAGMRAGKATPYQGGTRVPSFWRWPAAWTGGVDCSALTAHIDIFPTLAEIAGAKLGAGVQKQVEGRSLLPLLKNPQVEWPERLLVTHVGRWERGRVAEAKFKQCSIRDDRFTLVNNIELYDLKSDPGETKNILAEHPATAAKLRAAYDEWWQSVLPLLVNENATGPKVNPFKALYWKQFGGGPDEALRKRMDPEPVQSQGVKEKASP